MAPYKNFSKTAARPAMPFDASQVATGTHIFCDGACEPNPGAGGWGFVVYLKGKEIFHSCGGAVEATNNTMELTGMLEALRWMRQSVMLGRPVTIWCDSQYVVNGCNDWRHKWKKQGWSRKGQGAKPGNGALANVDLWKAIDELLNQCAALTIKWVKGHNGTRGNERADQLSNEGRSKALLSAGAEDPIEVDDPLTAEYRQVIGFSEPSTIPSRNLAHPDPIAVLAKFMNVFGIMTDGPDDSDEAMAASLLAEAVKEAGIILAAHPTKSPASHTLEQAR